jgi:hypothetical protein
MSSSRSTGLHHPTWKSNSRSIFEAMMFRYVMSERVPLVCRSDLIRIAVFHHCGL